MLTDFNKQAKIFKAFCDENRLCILSLLKTGEKCACDLLEELQISQPTLSHHMKILSEAGIVIGRREKKWIHYSINVANVELARNLLENYSMVTDTQKSMC